MDRSIRLIESTWGKIARSGWSVLHRPLRASHNFRKAMGRLREASSFMVRAERELARMNEAFARGPECPMPAPELKVHAELVAYAGERFAEVAATLRTVSADVCTLHESLLLCLENGLLVPEPPADRRRRIRLTPRPSPIRAFLRVRQPRVADRIAAVLRRRRSIPLPATVRVPRRSLLGRAPPDSISLL